VKWIETLKTSLPWKRSNIEKGKKRERERERERKTR
jgi:hypothetical protein